MARSPRRARPTTNIGRHHRHGCGFTLSELLVVTAIIGVLITELVPSVRTVREEERLGEASSQTADIGLAEDTFAISHGSYGTLSELIADGLVPGDLTDAEEHGYGFVIDIDPPPLPEFRVRAEPLVPPISTHFFIDQSQVLRYALDGPADAASTVFVDVASVPRSQAQMDLDEALEADAASFLRDLDALPGTGNAIDSTIALLATPGLIDAILAGLDENSDGELSIQEFLAADTLAQARSIIVAEGLEDDGTVVAGDALLNAMLADYKAGVDTRLQPAEGYVAPGVVYAAGLPGDPVGFLLEVASAALPALGPIGGVLLVALLVRATRTPVPRAGRRREGVGPSRSE